MESTTQSPNGSFSNVSVFNVSSSNIQQQTLVLGLVQIKFADNDEPEDFVHRFGDIRQKLVHLERSASPRGHMNYAWKFVIAVQEDFPSWARRTGRDLEKTRVNDVNLDSIQQDFLAEVEDARAVIESHR